MENNSYDSENDKSFEAYLKVNDTKEIMMSIDIKNIRN
jgi:hypothetical protein